MSASVQVVHTPWSLVVDNWCKYSSGIKSNFELTLSKALGLWHRSLSGSMGRPDSAWEQRGRAAGHTLLAELHGALPPPHHACSHPHIRTASKGQQVFIQIFTTWCLGNPPSRILLTNSQIMWTCNIWFLSGEKSRWSEFKWISSKHLWNKKLLGSFPSKAP